jgi:hypothetical protein
MIQKAIQGHHVSWQSQHRSALHCPYLLYNATVHVVCDFINSSTVGALVPCPLAAMGVLVWAAGEWMLVCGRPVSGCGCVGGR